MLTGIKSKLKEEITKRSSLLDRDAKYSKTVRESLKYSFNHLETHMKNLLNLTLPGKRSMII